MRNIRKEVSRTDSYEGLATLDNERGLAENR
jgi:hypothetical protein